MLSCFALIFTVSLLLGFSLSLFMMYLLMPVVMRMSSATAVNLSILSADFYALLIGVYVFQYKVRMVPCHTVTGAAKSKRKEQKN